MPRLLLGVLLLLLVSASTVRAQGEAVLYIDAEPVGCSEFEYYYRKVKGKTPEAYLPAFIDYKLKARFAKDNGLDTLSAFRLQLAYYQGKLLKSYLVDAGKEEQEARQIYERSKQRLQTKDWVQIAHISKYLPQNADRKSEQAARLLMDSIYTALQGGADFSQLARRYSDDAESRVNGGILPWMPVNQNVQEWVDKLVTLEKEKVSVPFYSPLGVHIVKWLDRKPCIAYEEKLPDLQDYIDREGINNPAINKEALLALYRNGGLSLSGNAPVADVLYQKYPELKYRMQELHDALLASYLSRKYQQDETAYGEKELERFYKQHKSDYSWDLPRYKGAVIHCKDKKTASAIKKYLKKKPVGEWKAALEKIIANTPVPQAQMEVGLFAIGKNKYVDKLVFKCGGFEPVPGLPYTFVMGKKLKKGPESYLDVKEVLIRDYQAIYDDTWMKGLKQKYKVEINQ
ncbi:peptidylprolyl isomerase, partial [Phocaeicola sp.]